MLTVERGFRSCEAAGIYTLEFERIGETLAVDVASAAIATLAVG
tara:strand:- start:129 stop:260 length:132 start_codon:yes stop_codon:yes gene_type:complete